MFNDAGNTIKWALKISFVFEVVVIIASLIGLWEFLTVYVRIPGIVVFLIGCYLVFVAWFSKLKIAAFATIAQCSEDQYELLESVYRKGKKVPVNTVSVKPVERRCPECTTPLLPDETYCPNCGTRVAQDNQ